MASGVQRSLVEDGWAWAVDQGLVPASAMVGYHAAWEDNFWRMAPGVGAVVLLSLYWSMTERQSAAARSSEPWWSTALHQTLVNLGLILIIIPIPGLLMRILPDAPALAWAGSIITGLGALFAVVARRALGRNWSREVRVAEGHELVRTGPYRLVRHPIYTGALMMYVGFVLSSGRPNALIGLALIALSYVRKIGLEERAMHEAFGAAFEDYRRHSRAIIPFVL